MSGEVRNVRKVLLCASLALLAVGLMACGEEAPEAGYVTDKDYRPAYDEHYTTYVCVSYDEHSNCNVRVPFDNVRHHADQWSLHLENCEATDKDGKPKCRNGWRPVTHETYDRYQIGQHYPDAR